jgi:pimeloyl-ACP methyl ester carboxylesterase
VCRITCPALLVHGRDDRIVPVDDARRIAARGRATGVRLLEIADAGHDSTEQIPHYVGEIVRFLAASCAAGA